VTVRPADVIALTVWPESVLDSKGLDDGASLTAVETPTELALVVARAVEHPEEIETLELVLKSASSARRLSPESPAVWARCGDGLHFAFAKVKPFAGQGPAADFAGV
jgi:hypothetical protein